MAEILLEPSSLSKIIPLSFDLNDTNASNAAQLMTKRQFNTADTDAWFQVTIDGFLGTAGSFDITLFNLNDKSVFNHTGKPFTTNPFYYKLDSGSDETTNEIRHAGRWIGQIVVTLANGDSATRKFIFDIEGHILDGADVQTILLEDYNALITTITASKDLLTQYNVDYAALIADVDAAEALRVQAEADRVTAFNTLVNSTVIEQTITQEVAEKYQEIEALNAPEMVSFRQQLEQTLNKSAITLTHMFADNAARDAYFVANPTELMEQLFIKVGTGYQQYLLGVWSAASPIVAEQVSATNQPIVDTGNYFATDNTNAALQELGAHKASTTNPHGVTKTQVGLGNVDNTSDANKPVSTAMQTALNLKANKVQEAWITPTLLNGWNEVSNFPIRYMKDEMGFVHLRGRAQSGTVNMDIFKLPDGYRPYVATQFLVPHGSANSSVRFWVSPLGELRVDFSYTTSIDLTSISFKAER